MPLIKVPTWEMTIKEFPLIMFDLNSVDFKFRKKEFTIKIQERAMNNLLICQVFQRLIQGLPWKGFPGNFHVPTPVTFIFEMKNDAGKVINESKFLNCYVNRYDIDYCSTLSTPTIHNVEVVFTHYAISEYPHGRDEFFDPYAAYDRAMGIIKT